MKTENLIAELALDPGATPLRPAPIVVAVLGLVAVFVMAFLSMAGFRAGLATALIDPLVASKTLGPALLSGVALAVVLRLMRPEGTVPMVQRAMIGAIVAMAAVIYALGYATQDRALWFADLGTDAVVQCLGFIILISTPALALSFAMVRRGASTAPARTGAALGLGVSAAATAGYSLYCTQDNPIFFVTWYGAGILTVTALGAIMGRRLLRW